MQTDLNSLRALDLDKLQAFATLHAVQFDLVDKLSRSQKEVGLIAFLVADPTQPDGKANIRIVMDGSNPELDEFLNNWKTRLFAEKIEIAGILKEKKKKLRIV